MTPPAPARTIDQRLAALERANEIRSYRAVLKKDLKAGRAAVLVVLRSDDPLLQSMRVREVLMAAPKIGRVKAERALNRCRVSMNKTLGGLSDRQRREITKYVATNYPKAVR